MLPMIVEGDINVVLTKPSIGEDMLPKEIVALSEAMAVFVGSSFGMNWMKMTMYVVIAATICNSYQTLICDY